MPIYEYTCQQCQKIFSELQSVSATEKDTKCPACGSGKVKRNLSGFYCGAGSNPSVKASSGTGFG